MKKTILFFITCFLFCELKAQSKQQDPSSLYPLETFKNTAITYRIIHSHNNTWGYDILIENKIIIHQPSIPAISGHEGFKTKEAAQKVADLVIQKMKKGEMPPSITIEEMKKLKTL